MRQFLLFCVSGGLGFGVDAGITQSGVSLLGLDPWSARALAFLPAVTCTWGFNRQYTFRATRHLPWWREWWLYLGTQLGGLSVNLSCYALLVGLWSVAARWPALAVACGSVAGLAVNFLAARRLVFGASSQPAPAAEPAALGHADHPPSR